MAEKVLVVDDEPNYRLIIGQVLESEGYEVLESSSGREAFELFRERLDVDLVLTDITMPDGDGLELLSKVKAERSEVPVVMLTANIDVRLAVEATKKGAFDYLTKPYDNEELVRCVKKALEVSSLSRQNKELKAALTQRHSFGSLIGKSKPMLELYQLLEKVSPTKANVLITGESGTGKELVARAIHYNSPRADKSFVAVNCSALSESLLASELFGYEKGAYTGAGSGRAGRFELAHNGTLFLDEVGEMGHSVQVTLLRVLQERTIERVGGGGKLIEVDARLITATNRDLKSEAQAGRFREDLYFRLNVVHLRLPSLRERLDDLPILIELFIDKYAQERPARPRFNSEAMRQMYSYRWPGNVRELENVVERCLVLAPADEITPRDLPEEFRSIAAEGESVKTTSLLPREIAKQENLASSLVGPEERKEERGSLESLRANLSAEGEWLEKIIALIDKNTPLSEVLDSFEEALLRKAMKLGNGVQSRAADILGLRRNVFKYKWDKRLETEPSALSEKYGPAVPEGGDLALILNRLEEELLRRALKLAGGSASGAAALLGVKKNLMPYKLKKYPTLLKLEEE
ncbi:MAG: sigma-54 dependent transcriptional regulator [Deltaproteobacteria bacterium]|jgi:two-component system NtrC family response regulator|nr:sigma-54 dependent transcriptional regulator [Deltaproteobacteria bacterium]